MKGVITKKKVQIPQLQVKLNAVKKNTRDNLKLISTKEKYKIFYVDDNAMIRKSLWRIFEGKDNFIPMAFSNGEDFMEYIDEQPEIAILDYHLTESMNGMDILNRIKEQSPKTKVIMLSSQKEIAVAVECLKKGANDYLIKDGVMRVNVKRAVNDVVQSLELEKEIELLSATIKRDKLMIKGYFIIIMMLVLLVGFLFLS